jgi:hypothetical protein
MHQKGRLSLRKGEGRVRVLPGPLLEIEPLTFILSPCARGEAENKNAVKSANFQREFLKRQRKLGSCLLRR